MAWAFSLSFIYAGYSVLYFLYLYKLGFYDLPSFFSPPLFIVYLLESLDSQKKNGGIALGVSESAQFLFRNVFSIVEGGRGREGRGKIIFNAPVEIKTTRAAYARESNSFAPERPSGVSS